MKSVLIVLGGAADRPRADLDGRTPLRVARTPALDALAEEGKVGRARLVPAGAAPVEETVVQTLLGYAPAEIVPGGGAFEAVGLGAEIGAADAAYRLSLVTTLDGALVDPTAGGIGTAEATVLLEALEEPFSAMRAGLAVGNGHAHVLVARDRPAVAATVAPEEIVGGALHEHLPEGTEGGYLRGLMDRAAVVLAEHEVNRIRVDLGENPADAIWPWAGGRLAGLPALDDRLGRSVAGVTDDPLVAGLLAQAGVSVTREASRAQAVLEALGRGDLVVVHAGGPGRVSAGDSGARVRAIETADRELVAPLLDALREGEPARLLVVATPLGGRERDEAPFVLAGRGVTSVRRFRFDEEGARGADLRIDRGHLLVDYLLARPARPGGG